MITTLDQVNTLEQQAEQARTPCGDGVIVWHCWGDGPPIVLLHGGSGSWTHWTRNIEALVASGRRVLVPDLPGFGDSARPPSGEDADSLPDPVEAGLKQLLGATACDLVGFSFGSMVASFLAAQYPPRAHRLVLVGAPALGVPMAPLALRAWSHLPVGAERSATIRYNLGALMLHQTQAVDELAEVLQTRNLVRDRLTRRRISKTDVIRQTLPAVTCPIFGIWGARDALYRGQIQALNPALQAAPAFRQLVLIAGAGHWVQFEEASAFNAVLASMLAG